MAPRELHGVGDVFSRWASEGKGESMERGHRATAGRVLASLPLRAGERFLDLGTGNGWAARDAAARGARAVGVDVAEGMLRRARERGRGVDYVRASLGHLPFRDGAFDWAFSVEALYYAPDLDGALAEARRALAAGGELHAVVDRYEENPDSHDWTEVVGVPMHLLSERQWERAVGSAGFAAARAERVRAEDGDPWHATHGSLHLEGRRP